MIGLLAKFINSEIMTKGGDAEPLDVLFNRQLETTSENLVALIELIISRGMVKSVQRGIVKFIGGTQTINISPINPDNSKVLIDNHILCVASGTVYGARLMGLTSTTLLLSANYTTTSGPYTTYYEASWQVIESY